MKYKFFIAFACIVFSLSIRAQVSFVLTNSVCSNDTVMLVANINAYPATSFSWVSQPAGVVFSTPTNSISNMTFTNAGTYTITLMASVGNSTAYANHTIQVHPSPQIVITANNGTICSSQNATLIATGASSYTWVPSVGFVVAYAGTAQVSPGTTSIYSVSGTNGWGCSANQTYTIVFSSFPTLATISTATAVCAGYTATLTAFGANSYTWKSSQFFSPVNQQTVVVSPGTFTLIGSNGGSCRDSTSITIGLTPPLNVSILADRTIICSDGGDTLVPVVLTASGAITYVWAPFQPGLMTYSIGQITAISPSATTCYTLTGSTVNCEGIANVCIQVQTCENISETTESNGIVIYPNPVKDILSVNLTSYENTLVEVYDVYGNCLLHKNNELIQGEVLVLNFSEFANGFYCLKLVQKNKLIHCARIVKE